MYVRMFCRFTVLMLGATEVGKTLLTNQFMSASDVGAYSSLTGKIFRHGATNIFPKTLLQFCHKLFKKIEGMIDKE